MASTLSLANSAENIPNFLPVPDRENLNTAPSNLPLGLNLDRLVNQLTEFTGCLVKFSDPDRGLPNPTSLTTCAQLILKALLHSSVFRANPDAGPVSQPNPDPVNNPKGGKNGGKVIIQPVIIEKPKPKVKRPKTIIKIIRKKQAAATRPPTQVDDDDA